MSITQQEGGTSSELTSTQGELPQETDPARGRGVPGHWLAEHWLYNKRKRYGPEIEGFSFEHLIHSLCHTNDSVVITSHEN